MFKTQEHKPAAAYDLEATRSGWNSGSCCKITRKIRSEVIKSQGKCDCIVIENNIIKKTIFTLKKGLTASVGSLHAVAVIERFSHLFTVYITQ